MIILHTNLVLEFTGAPPDPWIFGWLRTLPVTEIGTTAVQTAEILKGQANRPAGRRSDWLLRHYPCFLVNLPGANVLAFDKQDVPELGNITSHRTQLGRPIKEMVARIAANSVVHGYPLATRDIGNLEECGIALINPFTYKG